MKIDLIVARSLNNVIGNDNKIPWSCKGDMAHFKQMTQDNVIIMGNNTYKSIGKALPNRHNFVISKDFARYRQEKYEGNHLNINFMPNLEEAIHLGNLMGKSYIIGGSSVYKYALENDLVDSIILTTINKEYEGDAYFEFKDEWQSQTVLTTNEEYTIEILRKD